VWGSEQREGSPGQEVLRDQPNELRQVAQVLSPAQACQVVVVVKLSAVFAARSAVIGVLR